MEASFVKPQLTFVERHFGHIYALAFFASLVLAISPLLTDGSPFYIVPILCAWAAIFVMAIRSLGRSGWWFLIGAPIITISSALMSLGHMSLGHMFIGPIGHPPPIAEGENIVMEGMPVADAQWTATLRRHFPPGTSESKVVEVLRRQGFEIDLRHHAAQYKWPEPFCTVILEADWSVASDQRLTSIAGISAGMCL